MDNITVGGRTQEHDLNLSQFYKMIKSYFEPYQKCYLLKVLNYWDTPHHNDIKPDPDRLSPLVEMPAPHDNAFIEENYWHALLL